jgi:lysophospholipase L1-like esterase
MLSITTLLSVLAVLGPAQAIRYLGRVNPATKELSWSGTAVSFTFFGKSAQIGLEALSGASSAELIVDGKSTYIPSVTGSSISTPSNLTTGNHTVIFRKSSEAQFGSIFIGNITVDGTFGPDIPVKDRKLEIIGDSITSAYGIGGTLPCTNTAALEIISEGYSIRTADALNADLSIISWSGIGIIRNYASGQVDTSPIMPERYTKYGANDASNSYTFPAADAPDAVVVNLGTNDFGHNNVRPKLTGAEYTAAMVEFVKDVDSGYGNNATFFLLTSTMLNDGYPAGEMVKSTQRAALGEAVEQLGGSGIEAYVVDWPDQGSDLGCDYHPTPNTNAVGARVLTEAIQGVLGW